MVLETCRFISHSVLMGLSFVHSCAAKSIHISTTNIFKCRILFISRNKAIADYLRSNGFVKALAEFQKEADMVITCMTNHDNIVAQQNVHSIHTANYI